MHASASLADAGANRPISEAKSVQFRRCPATVMPFLCAAHRRHIDEPARSPSLLDANDSREKGDGRSVLRRALERFRMPARLGHRLLSATGVGPVIATFSGDKSELRQIGRRSVLAAVAGTVDTFLWRAVLQSVVAGGAGVIVPVVLMGANLVAGQRVRNALSRQVAEIGFRSSGRLGREVFGRLQLMPKSYFSSKPNSQVQSLVLNDVSTVRDTFCNVAERLVMNSLAIGSTMVGLTIMSPALTLVMAAPLGVLAVSSAYATWRSKAFDDRRQSAWSKVMEVVQDRLSPRGAISTRQFARERHAEETYIKGLSLHSTATLHALRMRLRLSSLAENAYAAGMLMGTLMVGTRMIDGVSTATFVAFFSLSARLFVPITQMPQDVLQVRSGFNAAKRLTEVLERSTDALERRSGVQLEREITGSGIEFDNVTFGPGQHLALVGRSGQGKSTLLDLLMGHYQPQSGQVRINGHDIRDVERRSLAGLFAVVDQHTTLFTGTIAENLLEAKPHASLDELIDACRSARLHDEIMAMGQGYETLISNQNGLSGGQRQRLAIAKALLKDAPVVLLDEATASVDSETARAIICAADLVSQGKTVITTSHQLTTLHSAERIAVLNGGRISEEGKHCDLMQLGGLYASAWRAHTPTFDAPAAKPVRHGDPLGGLGRSL